MFERWKARRLVYRLVSEGPEKVAEELTRQPTQAMVPYLVKLLSAEADEAAEGHKLLSKISGHEVKESEVKPTNVSVVAAYALAKLAAPEARDLFILLLTASEPRLRRSASAGLAAIGEKTWAQWVRGDKSDVGRLIGSKSPKAAEALCFGLRHQDYEAREGCKEGLLKAGPVAVEPLIRVVSDPANGPSVRQDAARILGDLGDPRASEALLRVLGYLDGGSFEEVRLAGSAAIALGQLKEPRAVEPIVKHYELDTPGIGRCCFDQLPVALGLLRDRRGTPALLKAADNKARMYALPAVQSLGELGDPAAVEFLSKLLLTPPEELVRKYAASSFHAVYAQFSPNPALAGALASVAELREADEVRTAAAVALGRIGDPFAVVALTVARDDASKEVAEAAVAALARIAAGAGGRTF